MLLHERVPLIFLIGVGVLPSLFLSNERDSVDAKNYTQILVQTVYPSLALLNPHLALD